MTREERYKTIAKRIYFIDWLLYNHYGFGEETHRDLKEAVEIINSLSAVPEREKGEWVHVRVGRLFPSNDYKCSICGNILNFDGVNCGRGDANFCPNCGANMKGV